MKIILEGCDGTGKTTLAKILAERYGLDICHCTQKDPADYEFYRQTLRKENVIWDRHTLGELIYPNVFARKPKIGVEDARLLMMYAREADVRTFVLTADLPTIRKRVEARGDEAPAIVENLKEIDTWFKFYARQFHVPVINTSEMSLREIFELVETPQENKGGFYHG